LILIGSFTYVGSLSCHIKSDSGSIEIGDGCMIANSVNIHTSDHHPIYELSTGSRINPDKSVKVMRHVWIGGNVSIHKGVTIHQDSVIGRGAIVTKDVDSNCVYAGVPARKVKSGITWDNFMNSSYEEAQEDLRLISRNSKIKNFCIKYSIDSDLFFHPSLRPED
jgi:acetyltransferase-like isoleucine patch superfamily enzyme